MCWGEGGASLRCAGAGAAFRGPNLGKSPVTAF